MKNPHLEIENLSIEEKKVIISQSKSREIVATILDYGVSQQQILAIIKLLALELEDIHLSQQISKFVTESRQSTNIPTQTQTKIYT